MQTKLCEKYMELAIREASVAKTRGNWPFGAVVVYKDKIVGKGGCHDKTTGDVTDHAELIALRNACKSLYTNNLRGCTIYCSNEPCLMCAAGIFQANIDKVVIGASRKDLPHLLRPRKFGIENVAEDSGYKIEIVKGLLKDKVLKLFTDIKKH